MNIKIKPEELFANADVFFFKIPNDCRSKATSWNLKKPLGAGSMKLMADAEGDLVLQLLDQDDDLYFQVSVNQYPGETLQPTLDSSRYFSLRISSKHQEPEFVGIGFSSRSESSSFTKALNSFIGTINEANGSDAVPWSLSAEPDTSYHIGEDVVSRNIKSESSESDNEDEDTYYHQGTDSLESSSYCIKTEEDSEERISSYSYYYRSDVDDIPLTRKVIINENESKSSRNICPVCGKMFSDIESLRRHHLYAYRIPLEYPCSTCSLTCSSELELEHHKKTHLEYSPSLHECNYCGITFADKWILESHVLSHYRPEKTTGFEETSSTLKPEFVNQKKRHSESTFDKVAKKYRTPHHWSNENGKVVETENVTVVDLE